MAAKKRRVTRLLGLLGLLLVGLASGCKDNDREQLRKVGRKGVEHLQDLAGGPNGKAAAGLDAVRGTFGDRPIDSRVATRLRWDKNLTGSQISVKRVQPGVVQLEGTVASADQTPQAEEVAKNTAGVEKVIVKLTVQPPPPPKPPAKD